MRSRPNRRSAVPPGAARSPTASPPSGRAPGQQRLKLKPEPKPRGFWCAYAHKLEALLLLERVRRKAAERRIESLEIDAQIARAEIARLEQLDPGLDLDACDRRPAA